MSCAHSLRDDADASACSMCLGAPARRVAPMPCDLPDAPLDVVVDEPRLARMAAEHERAQARGRRSAETRRRHGGRCR